MPDSAENRSIAGQEIYFELGVGTRMRRFMEQLTADSDRLYEEANLKFRVSYFYAMYAVIRYEQLTIADIAKLAGFSHSAVSQTLKRMAKDDLVEAVATSDGRQKMIRLTEYGEEVRDKLVPIWAALEQSMKDIMTESGYNLVEAIAGLEERLKKKAFYDRVQNHLQAEENNVSLEIVPYHTAHKQAYYDLNVDWMETTQWSFEPKDFQLLSNPETYILDRGGEIFFALKDGVAVGTVTMKQAGSGQFELAKLIVSEGARGCGAGVGLCRALVDRFKARGGSKLFLETNSSLTPAIELYKRVGFIEQPVPNPSYERTDYYMEWCDTSRKAVNDIHNRDV